MTHSLAGPPVAQVPSVQSQTQILATASHDLRQPLNALQLYLGELGTCDLPERARRAVHDAWQCARMMDEMLGATLALSRLQAGHDTPRISYFCISSVLDSVARAFAPQALALGVQLTVRPRRQLVLSDPVMVQRIAMNFVSNALRHAPGGRVLVGCRMRGSRLRLSVHDNGPGIPRAQQQAVFQAFYRGKSTGHPDHTGGFGLGLAIVRQLSQALAAPLTVRSTPGHGTLFAVDLPTVRASSDSLLNLKEST